MVTIGGRSIVKQQCFVLTYMLKKRLYKYFGKCDDKQQYKSILEAAMVYTPDGPTSNSLMSLRTSVTLNKPIVNCLDHKQEEDYVWHWMKWQ